MYGPSNPDALSPYMAASDAGKAAAGTISKFLNAYETAMPLTDVTRSHPNDTECTKIMLEEDLKY